MAETKWLLKTPDALYGPESQERLISWAKAGKIQPGQSISTDGEEWISVTEVPFLDMRWSIDIQDGKPPRGPFHREAVDALVARGRLPENVKIIEVREPWPQDEFDLEEPSESAITENDYIIDEEITGTEEKEIKETTTEEVAVAEETITEENTAEEPTLGTDTESEQEIATVENKMSNTEEVIPEENNKQMDLPNLPPDASVLYGLMKEEVESLTKLIESEIRETEEFRKASLARQERMQERRQSLLRIIGSDADDMVRRARINHPSFSQDDRLRQDYNALKLLQERVTQEAKNKIDILTDRLNKSEFEVRRLRQQLIDTATLSKQLIEARATLQRREKEIITERQRFEEERQRFAIERQTLMTRLSALETGLPGGTNQSREAHSIKLAPWMGLIK
jgi:hypothetical protein